jgi:hypothetical protein
MEKTSAFIGEIAPPPYLAVIASLLLAIGAIIAAVIANRERLAAENELRLNTSARLAATAISHKDDQTDLASLLSVEALHTADTFEARDALLTVLQTNPKLYRFFQHISPRAAV